MKSESVTISREEYDHLKSLEKIDWELVGKFTRGLEDLKAGKATRVR